MASLDDVLKIETSNNSGQSHNNIHEDTKPNPETNSAIHLPRNLNIDIISSNEPTTNNKLSMPEKNAAVMQSNTFPDLSLSEEYFENLSFSKHEFDDFEPAKDGHHIGLEPGWGSLDFITDNFRSPRINHDVVQTKTIEDRFIERKMKLAEENSRKRQQPTEENDENSTTDSRDKIRRSTKSKSSSFIPVF